DVTAGERLVGVRAQHLAAPVLADAGLRADADRDDHVRALEVCADDPAEHRRALLVAARVARVGVAEVARLPELRHRAALADAAIGRVGAIHGRPARLDVDVRRRRADVLARRPARRGAELGTHALALRLLGVEVGVV